MKILDGTHLSACIKDELKNQVAHLQKTKEITPCLAVILIGDGSSQPRVCET